jgi:perosamine synthetase
LHPYYEQTYGWRPEQLPVASAVWQRLVTLPLFPGMTDDEQHYMLGVVREICQS